MTTTQLHRRNLSIQLLTIGAVAILAVAGIRSTSAAIITWGGATSVTGDTDVSLNGTLVGALDVGGGGSTVNGVAFAADPGGLAVFGVGSMTYTFSFDASINADFHDVGGLSAAYDGALDTARWDGGTSQTVTLGGLLTGKDYEVQAWYTDTRGCCDGRVVTLDGAVTLAAQGVGGHGEYALGTFLASGSTQTIGITSPGGQTPQLNLIQVRDISVPEPSTFVLLLGGFGLMFYGVRRFKAA